MFNLAKWKTALGVPAGVLSIALLGAPVANAGAIAYSNLNVSLGLVSGGQLIDQNSITFDNDSGSNAGFNGLGISRDGAEDVLMTCAGDCVGIAQNDFTRVSSGNGAQFARADARLSGAINEQGGAAGQTVAETQILDGSTSAFGVADVGSTISLLTFTTNGSGVISLGGSALGQLFLKHSVSSAVSTASFGWQITAIGSNNTFQRFTPETWNARISLNGGGLAQQDLDDAILFNFDVVANTRYDIEVAHNSVVRSEIPVPATLALFGLGLIGLGGVTALRRRKA